MRVHFLQHSHLEGMDNLRQWFKEKNLPISGTKFFEKNYKFPNLDEFDWLIIVGGPMNVYQEEQFPWLKEEKKFIKQAIENNKIIWGICLGAQLIADILGAKIVKNKVKEIGWFEVETLPNIEKIPLLKHVPKKFIAFHWHEDMFQIPSGAIPLFTNTHCDNQGFFYSDRIFAIQFHLEVTEKRAQALLKEGKKELENKKKSIQNEKQILAQKKNFEQVYYLLKQLLNNFYEKFKQK